jgi:LmbE family N-acetylglucosaminyl deacetylase
LIPILDTSRVQRILCIGAHCDDIEIGAGGTLLRLIAQQPALEVRWLVLCAADPVRAAEARDSFARFCAGAVSSALVLHAHADAFLPWRGEAVKQDFEALKREYVPDLVFTHHGADRHQDHRLVSELSWNTWRDATILEYEIVKWDGDLGQPNVYVPLDETTRKRKAELLLQCYPSQRARPWFAEEVFNASMRLRGVECNAPSGYAEAFHARKLVL